MGIGDMACQFIKISYLLLCVSERQNFVEKCWRSVIKLSAGQGVNTLMSKIFDECEISVYFEKYYQKSVFLLIMLAFHFKI